MICTSEQFHRRGAERLFQLRQQGLERYRRDFALQAFELGDPLRRQQIDAGGQYLPELDEGRAELVKAICARAAAQGLITGPVGEPPRAPLQRVPGRQ